MTAPINSPRSLVTTLSFKLDKAQLDRLEAAVLNFKNKFVTASNQVKNYAQQTLDFFDSIARKSVATADLARNIGVASEDLRAFQLASSKITFNPDTFDIGIEHIKDVLEEGVTGLGEFRQIWIDTRHQLNLQPFIDSQDSIGAFKEYIAYLRTLKGDIQALKAASRGLFPANDVNEIIRYTDLSAESFDNLVNSYSNIAKAQVEAEGSNKVFLAQQQEFYNQLGNAVQEFAKFTIPAATSVLKTISGGFEGANNAIQIYKEKGATGLVDRIVYRTEELVNRLTGNEPIFRGNEGRALQGLLPQGITFQPANINTSIEINVPQGTSEEQLNFMADEMQFRFNHFLDEKIREVNANNPQAE